MLQGTESLDEGKLQAPRFVHIFVHPQLHDVLVCIPNILNAESHPFHASVHRNVLYNYPGENRKIRIPGLVLSSHQSSNSRIGNARWECKSWQTLIWPRFLENSFPAVFLIINFNYYSTFNVSYIILLIIINGDESVGRWGGTRIWNRRREEVWVEPKNDPN